MRLALSDFRIRTGIALAALSAAAFTLSAGPAHAQQVEERHAGGADP